MNDIIQQDSISSISIIGNNNNTILYVNDNSIIYGNISNINDISLNNLESFDEYISVLKSADMKTLSIKNMNNNNNNNNIENKYNMIDIIYVKIPNDQQSLGIGVTFESNNKGLKIISIEENGFLSMKLGNKLQIGDTIITLNNISLEKLSPKIAISLLNDIKSKNRTITIHHYHENYKEISNINIKDTFNNIKYNYLQNRIKRDYTDMITLSNKYNLHPIIKKSLRIEQENLLKSSHRFYTKFRE